MGILMKGQIKRHISNPFLIIMSFWGSDNDFYLKKMFFWELSF
jgi:hypothetical protein